MNRVRVALVAFLHLLSGGAGHQQYFLHLSGTLLEKSGGTPGPRFQLVLDRPCNSLYVRRGDGLGQGGIQREQSGLQVFARVGAGLRSGFTDGG